MSRKLQEILKIQHPVIMAPMFLVSNVAMSLAAIEAGIAPCIPALNYRSIEEFKFALDKLAATGKSYGINLIVNQSNIKLKDQLQACLDYKVPFIITSLGSPKVVIEKARPLGIKVFCDVSDLEYAKKAAALGPDALIAVTNLAGGHAGQLAPEQFIPALVKAFPDLPIISAGGVYNRSHIDKMLSLGACGVSVGSIFIASIESPVNQEYKQACVEYGAKDIVMTTKLSGVPCSVINTPYVREIGLNQNWIERLASKNKWLKKYLKMIIYKQGMEKLKRSAFQATYQNVWCAGPSIEGVHTIRPVKEIIAELLSS
ncbi:MAG TPA: nitronate monooxygenase [Saprospiraceae bacterium]|nr:nitronate monooxygenase [Saprospiraceae bacterium]